MRARSLLEGPLRGRAFVLLCLAMAACVGTNPAPEPQAEPSSLPTTQPTKTRGSVVLVTHPTRPPLSITEDTATALLAGDVANWRALGEPAGRMRIVAGPSMDTAPEIARAEDDATAIATVQGERSVLAVVPGSAVRPGVRAIAVDGIDPMRDPARYPLRARGEATGPVVEMLVVGDVMLGRHVGERARGERDPSFPLRLVAGRLAAADLTVGNFESTLARLGRPTQGDAFSADPNSVEGLRLAGFDVVSLANNHTGDFGPESLVETVRLLRRANIRTIGAGANAAAARRAVIVERDGIRFGFLAFNSIGETPPPGPSTPGAVRIRIRPRFPRFVAADLTAFVADVKALRAQVDVLVVLPHWGEQYSHKAHPDQGRIARAVIDAGADLVLASHPHWVQGLELYRDKLIAHSLGNFVFDQRTRETKEGLALRLVFWGATLKSVELHPVRIGDDYRPRFVTWRAGASIVRDVFAASKPPWRRS